MTTLGDLLAAIEDPSTIDPSALVRSLLDHPDLPRATGEEAYRAAQAIGAWAGPQQIGVVGHLARIAHQDGVAGAGPLAAQCVDRQLLMGGRPQRFGTVTMSHQGDMVMAPLDGSATDEDRASFGLPSLEELRTSTDQGNRERARARLGEPLPQGQRFARVWTDPSAAEIQHGLEAHPEGAWANGDVLTFAWRSDAAGLLPGPVFELPMWRLSDTDGIPTDLFAAQIKVERLDEMVAGYGFWELGPDGMPVGGRRGPVDHRFRGPAAPEQLPSHEDDSLLGSLTTHSFDSASLREHRPVVVYLPPGHDPTHDTPVVYSTDGNMFAPYARRLDAAIALGHIPPVIVVAPHAAPMDQTGNQRALEYLPGFDDQRFDRHQRFFVDELSHWAEATFGAARDREFRAVFGCSDGGAHSLVTGHLHRQRFGHCIAFSTGMPPDERLRWEAEGAPFVHLCAGTLEQGFHQATEAWAAWLHFHQSPHHWTERVCGHDLIQWIEELPRALARAWG